MYRPRLGLAEPLVSLRPDKDRIANNFGQAADQYERQAQVQAWAADQLGQWLIELRLPAGMVLEIGCGTGLLSRQLIRRFPRRPIQLSDLSPAMLTQCRQQVGALHAQLQFACRDGEASWSDSYALIASSFTLQWFEQPGRAIARWSDALLPGGYLLLAFPTVDSFPEWRAACARSGVPYSGLPLPAWPDVLAEVGDRLAVIRSETVTVTQPLSQPLAFFRQLRAIGAHTGCHTIQASQLRQLLRAWPQPTISYQVLLATLQRPGQTVGNRGYSPQSTQARG